jgi:hypothetical protein
MIIFEDFSVNSFVQNRIESSIKAAVIDRCLLAIVLTINSIVEVTTRRSQGKQLINQSLWQSKTRFKILLNMGKVKSFCYDMFYNLRYQTIFGAINEVATSKPQSFYCPKLYGFQDASTYSPNNHLFQNWWNDS